MDAQEKHEWKPVRSGMRRQLAARKKSNVIVPLCTTQAGFHSEESEDINGCVTASSFPARRLEASGTRLSSHDPPCEALPRITPAAQNLPPFFTHHKRLGTPLVSATSDP